MGSFFNSTGLIQKNVPACGGWGVWGGVFIALQQSCCHCSRLDTSFLTHRWLPESPTNLPNFRSPSHLPTTSILMCSQRKWGPREVAEATQPAKRHPGLPSITQCSFSCILHLSLLAGNPDVSEELCWMLEAFLTAPWLQ